MTLLRMTQADAQSVQAVQDYIDFTIELEEKCNLAAEVNEAFLQKYLSLASVERAIRDAIAEDRMDAEAYEAWLAEYAACSAGRIRLKSFFRQMDSYFAIHKEARQSIRTQNPGESLWFVIKSDMPEEACKLLFQMIGWDILDTERKGKRVSLSVIEGSKKYNTELLNLLNVTGADISFSLFSQDFFAGHSEEWKEKISEYFQRFVYSAHTRMESCEEISSKKFGTVPVVRNSYTVDRDRRIGNNHLLDQLLNTNRVDHYIQHTPVWEPRYRKEEIYEMPSGTCLVQTEDFEGFIQCL